MESFDEVVRKAKEQASTRKREEADNLRKAATAESARQRQAQSLAMLAPTVKHEALIVARALAGKIGTPEIYAIDFNDDIKARKMMKTGTAMTGDYAKWRVNRAERKVSDYRSSHSFRVWDTFARWEYKETSEPWETQREHYLLNRTGEVFYADYVGAQHGQNAKEPVVTRRFDIDEQYEPKLQTLRQGLGNLVAIYNLQLG